MLRYLLETGEKKAEESKEDELDENANNPSNDEREENEKKEKKMTGPGGRGFMSLVEERQNQSKLPIKKILELKVPCPEGVCLLADGSIAVASSSQQAVLRFSKTGSDLIPLESRIGFQCPTNILQLSTGEVAVADDNGLQLFGVDHRFLRTIGVEECDWYRGLAEDNEGRIVTINNNNPTYTLGKGTRTKRGHTDIFYFTKAGELVKTVELADLVREEMRQKSMCLYLGYSENKLFIVDKGLSRICCIFGQDGKEEAAVFGDCGNQQDELEDPAGIAVDEHGNSIVVDSGNNRLQLIDADYKIHGPLKVRVKTTLSRMLIN